MFKKTRDECQYRTIFQHSDNPEAVLIVTDLEMYTEPWPQPFVEWTQRVHDWLERGADPECEEHVSAD